jgi:hypothetical protein
LRLASEHVAQEAELSAKSSAAVIISKATLAAISSGKGTLL